MGGGRFGGGRFGGGQFGGGRFGGGSFGGGRFGGEFSVCSVCFSLKRFGVFDWALCQRCLYVFLHWPASCLSTHAPAICCPCVRACCVYVLCCQVVVVVRSTPYPAEGKTCLVRGEEKGGQERERRNHRCNAHTCMDMASTWTCLARTCTLHLVHGIACCDIHNSLCMCDVLDGGSNYSPL